MKNIDIEHLSKAIENEKRRLLEEPHNIIAQRKPIAEDILPLSRIWTCWIEVEQIKPPYIIKSVSVWFDQKWQTFSCPE
jgi:hypothetical protein